MNGLRLSLILAIGGVLFACSTVVCEKRSVKYDFACQGSVMKLRCFNRSFAIAIQSAKYGRNLPGSIICPKLDEMSSSSSDELKCETIVTPIVKERCDGRMNCTIPLNKETLDEPCPNVYKYLTVAYKCEDVLLRPPRKPVERHDLINLSPTSSVVLQPGTGSPGISSSSVAVQPTPVVLIEEQLSVCHGKTNSGSRTPSSRSSSRSVSVASISQSQFTATAIKNIRSTSLTSSSSNPAPKTTENNSVQIHAVKGQQGTMKLFHFILSFQIVREENIGKHTMASVVWFSFGVLVGLLIMIAVFVFFRVRRSRRKQLGKPRKASYSKQKMIHDEFMDEKVELHSKEIEALEMESQCGEPV